MRVSRKNKKAEAIKRMKLLGIYGETTKQFASDKNLVSVSEPPGAGLIRTF